MSTLVTPPCDSQARLQDIQRKRAELIRKRQLVRNYNDRDGEDDDDE